MKKVMAIGISSLLLVLMLAGCSSDPFKNAGKCNDAAATKIVDGKLAICTGFKKSLKWYFEGDSYEAIKTIGFIEASKANIGLENGGYDAFYKAVIGKNKNNASEILSYMFSSTNLQNSVQHTVKGNQRWDNLVASISSYVNKSSEADVAMKEQFAIASDLIKANNFKNKPTYSQKYVDAQKLHFQLSDEASRLWDKTAPLLQVLESYLLNEVGLTEPMKAAKALAATQHLS
jgi:hypothetical protein